MHHLRVHDLPTDDGTRLSPRLPDRALSMDDRRPNVLQGCCSGCHDDLLCGCRVRSRSFAGSAGRPALAAAVPRRDRDAQWAAHARPGVVADLVGMPATNRSRGSHRGCSGRPRGLPSGRGLRAAAEGRTATTPRWPGHFLVDSSGHGPGSSRTYSTPNPNHSQSHRRCIFAAGARASQGHHPGRCAATAGRGRVPGSLSRLAEHAGTVDSLWSRSWTRPAACSPSLRGSST